MHAERSVVPFPTHSFHFFKDLVSESQLNRFPLLWCTGGVVIWVPLQTNGGLLPHSPFLLLLTCQSFGEDGVESMASDPHGQHSLLPLLGAPATAIHHPQEIWLYPGHSTVRKLLSTKPRKAYT